MNSHMKNSKYNNTKKATAFVITTSVLMSNILPVFADGNTLKEEVVYAKLNEDGKINNIYIVNGFDSNKDIVDYGNYSNVLNLSTDDKLNYINGVLNTKSLNVDGKFYYQGKVESSELPWNISLKYYLDGKSITSEELAGKSGKLEIKLDITQNKNINSIFYDNYALQIALTLNGDKCKNVVSEDATIANVGSTKSINYIKLPGTDANYTLTADVTDFEMDAISINGMNMAISVDVDASEMTGDLNTLVEAIEAVNDGTGTLKDGLDKYALGVNSLHDGTSELKNGVSQYKTGVNSLDSGVESLASGIGEYKTGVKAIYKNSNELFLGLGEVNSGMKSFEGGLSQVKEGSNAFNQGLSELSKGSLGYKQALESNANSVKSSIDKIKSTLTEEQLEALQIELIKLEKGADGILDGYNLIDSGIKSTTSSYGELNSGINNLYTNIAPLKSGVNGIYNGMGEFNTGVGQLVQGIDGIDSGAKELKSGSSQLVTGIKSIDIGVTGLNDGSSQLVSGISEINTGASQLSSGTNELNEQTNSMPDEVDKQINEIMAKYSGKDFEPVSFASEENTNVESVQFAMRTDGVYKLEDEVKEVEDLKEEKPSIWDLFLALFNK